MYHSNLYTHEGKAKIEIKIVLCSVDIGEADDVWMAPKLEKKEDLPVCSLSVSVIPEGVEYFLQGHLLSSLYFHCFPDDSISLK